jgi:ABC-type Fe3+ transport system substrate-binding protein
MEVIMLKRHVLNGRLWLKAVFGLWAFGAVAAVPAVAAEFSPAMKDLIAAAQKEGTVSVSYGTSSLGGAKLIEAAMNKLFGTRIDVRFAPGPAMARVANQLMTESKAGQPAFTDMFVSAAAQHTPLVERKMLLAVDWKALLPDRIKDAAIEEGGMALRVGTGMSGVTYNSEAAPFKPARLADFLDPRWKGKIASTPYAASFDSLAANDMWGPKKTLDFLRKLSGQVAGLIRCGDMERIASREFAALVMDCTGQNALVWQEKGAPIAQMIPLDAAQLRYYYTSVPKHTRHPAAAKLFVAFLQTPEGQKIIWDTWKVDLHIFPESHMAKQVAELKAAGAEPKEVTISWWMQHPEITKTQREMVKILRKKKKK